jgi:hypothetical protein
VREEVKAGKVQMVVVVGGGTGYGAYVRYVV